jgi:hypothetical protein
MFAKNTIANAMLLAGKTEMLHRPHFAPDSIHHTSKSDNSATLDGRSARCVRLRRSAHVFALTT